MQFWCSFLSKQLQWPQRRVFVVCDLWDEISWFFSVAVLGEFDKRATTNVQHLDLSCSFYCLFFSFLIELKPFVLKGKVLGGKFWKSLKKCQKVWKSCNDFALYFFPEKRARKITKRQGIFLSLPNLWKPRKRKEKRSKKKGIPRRGKNKEFQKMKTRKDRVEARFGGVWGMTSSDVWGVAMALENQRMLAKWGFLPLIGAKRINANFFGTNQEKSKDPPIDRSGSQGGSAPLISWTSSGGSFIVCPRHFFNNPSGHGRPRWKPWSSAPRSAFSCGPGGGEKLFDPWASGRKGQECPREIPTKKFTFLLFFLPWSEAIVDKFLRPFSGGWQDTPPPKKRRIDTEYDRAKVPPYNGNDPPPSPASLKALLFPLLLNEVQNKGTQGVQARYGAELPPFISIVRHTGRPVIFREQKLNTIVFSQTFRAPLGYPSKIPGYPARKVWFPWLRGTHRTFWPPPVHVEDAYPTGKYPDQKVLLKVQCISNDCIHISHQNH